MKKIFVSYTRLDKYINIALLIKINDLIANRHCCYIDALHNDSKEKQRRVESELMSSSVMLLLRSCSVDDSNWVCREIEIASQNGISRIDVPISRYSTYEMIESQIKKALKLKEKQNI